MKPTGLTTLKKDQRFIDAWEAAPNSAATASKLGLSRQAVTHEYKKFVRAGVPLTPPKHRRHHDWEALKKYHRDRYGAKHQARRSK